jgi:hypothetical protein
MSGRYLIAAIAMFAAVPAHAETLTNATIISLVKSGVGDEVVIAVIERSEARFDLSTQQIITLKKQGVSPTVIAAMIRANDSGGGPANVSKPPVAAERNSGASSTAPASLGTIRSPGVYLLAGSKFLRIDPSASSQLKTGGMLGAALTAGIAAASMKAVIPGENARTKTNETMPQFYFYFGSGGQDAGGSSWAAAGTPTSPNEFSLVRLTSKNGRREAKVGKMGLTGAKIGVMDKDRVEFTYDEVRPGMYSVRPNAALAQGEYAFIATIGTGGAMSARIFDFTVQ